MPQDYDLGKVVVEKRKHASPVCIEETPARVESKKPSEDKGCHTPYKKTKRDLGCGVKGD